MAQLKTLPNPLPADWPHNLHIDYSTKIETLIPYTLEEYNEWDANAILDAARFNEIKAKEIEDANAKVALLNRLGITSDEAKLLLS